LFADCEVFAMIEDTTLDRRAILAEIDRVINDMVKLRARVASAESMTPVMSSKSWEIFDMWADRADMQGVSTVEWLNKLRREQWSPRDDQVA
jgi:hypothetical protein